MVVNSKVSFLVPAPADLGQPFEKGEPVDIPLFAYDLKKIGEMYSSDHEFLSWCNKELADVYGCEELLVAFLPFVYRLHQTGYSMNITSSFRTNAQQTKLYAAFIAGTGNTAARPGWSNHQRARAVDVHFSKGGRSEDKSRFPNSAWPDLSAICKEYGFIRPIKGEPWHVEIPNG